MEVIKTIKVKRYIGDTETYRVLNNVSISLPCSACHKMIESGKVIIAWCNKKPYRLHEKCWDGKGQLV